MTCHRLYPGRKAQECPSMPHAETIKMMQIMDALRAEWGVHYPESIESL